MRPITNLLQFHQYTPRIVHVAAALFPSSICAVIRFIYQQLVVQWDFLHLPQQGLLSRLLAIHNVPERPN
jgi:hypothetical protein